MPDTDAVLLDLLGSLQLGLDLFSGTLTLIKKITVKNSNRQNYLQSKKQCTCNLIVSPTSNVAIGDKGPEAVSN